MASPRHFLPILVPLLAVACAPRPSAPVADTPRLLAEPLQVHVEERFYPVAGTSAARINRDLAGRGPAMAGRRWHALTDFRLRWRYLPRMRQGRCTADAVRLDVEIVTTLPRWEDRGRASPDLASDWDLYLERLREHEVGHQRIVVLEGRELLDSVEGLAAPDCATLSDRMRRLAQAARGEVDAAHAEWDRATSHGVGGG